jgi:hypothetical protein
MLRPYLRDTTAAPTNMSEEGLPHGIKRPAGDPDEADYGTGREDHQHPDDIRDGSNSLAGDRAPSSAPDDGPNDAPKRKRQRVRLSCLECRRRKLSCDRNFPCDRCVRSGTADTCVFEAAASTMPHTNAGIPPGFARLDPRVGADADGHSSIDIERVKKLEDEVQQLKALLIKHAGSAGALPGIEALASGSENSSSTADDAPPPTDPPDGKLIMRHRGPTLVDPDGLEACPPPREMCREELRFLRGKEFRTRYYGPYNASMAFSELLSLLPSVRDNPDEWLRPIFLCDRKDRRNDSTKRDNAYQRRDLHLESLLPSRREVNALVNLYLSQFEQLHRIVHIPAFHREYNAFWNANDVQHTGRSAAFTALLLSILAVSSCVHGDDVASPGGSSGHNSDPLPSPRKYVGTVSTERYSAEVWIKAVQSWMQTQSMKHRRLVHFQIACLLYLGKRVNTIKKKRFWTDAGALTHDGIAVGLHRDPGPMTGRISVYNQEMRRRIWATVQEFDLQTSFDYGLPTILTSLHFDAAAPRNLDDDEFDEDSVELPQPRPSRDYTYSSFQNVARQSLPLRLELSRILYGQPTKLDYKQVARYSNDLSREIDSLPSWEANEDNMAGAKRPLIAYTLLHIQLRQYMIPLHQPFIKLGREHHKAEYQYSQVIYHNAARDIVQLHDRLYQQGIRALNFMREDCLTSAIYLCSVTMMQPQGSTNMIMINSSHTLKLLEKCLAMKEDRLLRCGNNEPWAYCIMCNTVGLLDVHLGNKTADEAKAWAHDRYVSLHQKLFPNTITEAEATPSAVPGSVRNTVAVNSPWPGKVASTPVAGPAALAISDADINMTPWMAVAMGGQQLMPDHNALAAAQNIDFGVFSGLDPDQIWNDNWMLG